MFAAAAVVRDDQGRTFYEHPDAFTTTQLVFFPRLTESELALYQADAIYEDEIEVLPRRRPQVPTILFTFCDEPNHFGAGGVHQSGAVWATREGGASDQ